MNVPGRVLAIALVLAACGPASAPASPSLSLPEPPAATAPFSPTPSAVATSAAPSALSPILTAQLTDVRTGDRFTLESLATGVVIVEGMAVW